MRRISDNCRAARAARSRSGDASTLRRASSVRMAPRRLVSSRATSRYTSVNADIVIAATASANPMAKRSVREPSRLRLCIQLEAGGAQIDNKAPGVNRVQLAPQISNVNVDNVGLRL